LRENVGDESAALFEIADELRMGQM